MSYSMISEADEAGSPLRKLETPCLLLERPRLLANIERLRAYLGSLGVTLRPHLKTAKNIEVARLALDNPSGPATVSTLKEAEYFLSHGITDLLYAVGIAPNKLDRVYDLRRRGADLSVILDNVESAKLVAARSVEHNDPLPALIEIDTDDHRSGVKPDDPALIEIGRILHEGGAVLRGVMTHSGASYGCRDRDAFAAMA